MSTKTCLRCTHYMNCTDEKKSFSYRCKSYSEDRDSNFVLDLGVALEKTKHPLFASGNISEKQIAEVLAEDSRAWFKADAAMSKIVNEKRLVSPDVRIPEDDFPKAPNFYTWCKSDKFLKQTPYLVQAVMGTILFADYCPHCSDRHYINGGYKVDDPLARFERKVALLEHGICPYCKRTRNRLNKKYGLKNYREFAAACGQRSGKSAFAGMCFSYLTHRHIKLIRPTEIYGVMDSEIFHGTFVALTFRQAFDTLWTTYHGALVDSPWFCLAEGTIVSTTLGNVEIQNIKAGTVVKTLEGESTVTHVFDNGTKECFDVSLSSGARITGTGKHKVRCLSVDGKSLVWKRVEDITYEDFVVEEGS